MTTTAVRRTQQEYHSQKTEKVSAFVDSLRENSVSGGTFDSATANDFIGSAINQDTGVPVPEDMQIILDEAYAGSNDTEKQHNRTRIIRAIFDGINTYESQHGLGVPADIVQHAIHMAYATTDHARNKFPQLDSANSVHHDQLSLQPNRAVVAIISSMGDAIPFAHYLPADIGSNEARLAILMHQAGSDYGMYSQNASMDGVNCGNAYLTPSRIHTLNPAVSTGDVNGALTTLQDTFETCDQGAATIKLLRGRSIVYVNGIRAAEEISASGTGNSVVSGSVTLSGTTYNIGGTINTDTGVFAITTTPAMPVTNVVTVEGFIDYERAPELIPRFQSSVEPFKLFAKAWRGYTNITPDARTQISQELGLDAHGESIIAIQRQLSDERHYEVLAKAGRLALNNAVKFDYDWTNRKTYMHRSDAWRDLATPLGAASQQMAINTFDHGITHLYVGKHIMADFLSLPTDIFVPSGVVERPGIFRIGRLFGRYEVYYTPKNIQDTAGSGQILGIGRASSVALNPFVLGDSVPTTMIPLGVGTDLKQGVGVYGRSFTEVNPYLPAQLGCAVINVTNLQ
ncbi:hypothetical protein [Nitrosomonas marina]|uniref:Uncharacterized protein n=1 Tax=Nitrosomonas marina TaxID=917 RepID=A0A1H8ILU5_9PROT|nr:hypothetical protein [Nitrosomonas marina]SEN69900.1 hypothetical protein SAMN05216325_13613 [Nitrosomonas marina]